MSATDSAIAIGVRKPQTVDRFWTCVNKRGPVPSHRPALGRCWIWTRLRYQRANRLPSYGHFVIGKTHVLAHRFAWATKHPGTKLPRAVRHHCDNVACVRPSHLEGGTQRENMADMRAKGRAWFNRFPSGTAHHNAKINAEIAAQIRAMRSQTPRPSLAKLGVLFGLDPSTVHDIVRGKTWRVE